MHSMDNYYVSKLLPLIAESGVCAIANPLINLTLQGRHDTYPRRRGMTRVAEMRALGIPVALGQDCVMEPWYSLGGADMLSVYVRGILVQLNTPDAIRGRVSAINSMFIGTSNELGEFESGVTARWFGAVRAVLLGGVLTLAVVGGWMGLFPELRRLDRLH